MRKENRENDEKPLITLKTSEFLFLCRLLEVGLVLFLMNLVTLGVIELAVDLKEVDLPAWEIKDDDYHRELYRELAGEVQEIDEISLGNAGHYFIANNQEFAIKATMTPGGNTPLSAEFELIRTQDVIPHSFDLNVKGEIPSVGVSVSPDQKYFLVNGQHQEAIIINTQHGEIVTIPGISRIIKNGWSPDSQHLLLVKYVGQKQELIAFNLETESENELISSFEGQLSAAWLNEEWILVDTFFTDYHTSFLQIFNVHTGQNITLGDLDLGSRPDYHYFHNNEGEVTIVAFPGVKTPLEEVATFNIDENNQLLISKLGRFFQVSLD